MKIYDFTVKKRDGSELDLSELKGKVVLVVNTATGCGFTPQYTDLARLYDEFEDKKFTVIEFPCNQFGGQAPGTDDEIQGFCRLEFGVKYPIYKKIDVNGENADPLYEYLKNEQPFTDITGKGATKLKIVLKAMDRHYKDNNDIKWNFTKFLVDREGNVVRRFEPTEDLGDVKEAIEALL